MTSAGTIDRASPSARLLLVDDEEPVRRALSRYLRSRGYDVATAESGDAALAAIEHERFSLVVCDVMMPGINGLEVVRRATNVDPDLAVMILSALNDAPTATEAMADGALDYLVKPIELAELDGAVRRALRKRELLIERRRVEHLIRDEVAQRTAELEREKSALRELSIGIAESLVNAMEAKDPYQRGHSRRVSELAGDIARAMGLSTEQVEQVALAARLQDVGRIGVRESVLNKPGTLSEEEVQHIRDHLRIGVEILTPLKHLGPVLVYVQDHHEHWDGEGYPRGLAGEEISIGGRILAAADAYSALTSERPYRARLAPEKAIEFMETLVGTLLDPEVYSALRRAVER